MGLLDQINKNKVATVATLSTPPVAPVAANGISSLVDDILAAAGSAEKVTDVLVEQAMKDLGCTSAPPIVQPTALPTKVKFGIKKAVTPQAIPAPSAEVANVPVKVVEVAAKSALAVSGGKDIAKADILNVEINTFERGSEKYTQEEMDALAGALSLLMENIKDPKIVGQSIKNVMYSLAENPELKTAMKPEDIGLMVRGLRESYGMHLAKRSDNAQARTAKVTKQKTMDDAFADIEF